MRWKKKRVWRQTLSLSLSVSMILSGCSSSKSDVLETKTEYSAEYDTGANGVNTYRHGTDYEEDYIQQHLDYLESAEYLSLTKGSRHGLAERMAEAYDTAALDKANAVWEVVSSSTQVFSGENVEIKNGYDLVISQLMQTTSGKQAFIDSYKCAEFDSILAFLKGFQTFLGSGSEFLAEYEQPGQHYTKQFAGELDALVRTLEKLQGVSEEEQTGLYGDALDFIKVKLSEYYPDLKEPKELRKIMDKLGVDSNKSVSGFAREVMKKTKEGAEIITDSYEELIDLYIFRMALSQATEEWLYSWELISGFAMASGDQNAKEISQTIDEILADLYVSSESAVMAYTEAMKEEGKNTLLRVSEKVLQDFCDEAAKKGNGTLALAKMAAKLGYKMSGTLFNMDDVAFSGRMLYKTGTIAPYIADAMDTAALLLKLNPTFQNALLFDELFHIYKETQIQACDYAIEYDQAMAEAGVNHVLKKNAGKYITDAQVLLTEKAVWEDYECHVFAQDCYAGVYVEMDDTAYYWKMDADSYQRENSVWYKFDFSNNPEHANSLIARNKNGDVTELFSIHGGKGKFWIVGDTVYGFRLKEDHSKELFGAKMDGSGIVYYGSPSYETGNWVGYDEAHNTMIGFTEENGVIAVDVNTKNVKTLSDAAPQGNYKIGEIDWQDVPILVTNGYLYYWDMGVNEGKDFVIRVTDVGTGEDKELYREENMLETWYGMTTGIGMSIRDVQETSDYVYLSFGAGGGSASLYIGGKILRLKKDNLFGADDSNMQAVLCERDDDAQNMKDESFMAVTENGWDRVYFHYHFDKDSIIRWENDDLAEDGGNYETYSYQPLGAPGTVIAENNGQELEYVYYQNDLQDLKIVLTDEEYQAFVQQNGYVGKEVKARDLEVQNNHLYGRIMIYSVPYIVKEDAVLEEVLQFRKDLENGEMEVLK